MKRGPRWLWWSWAALALVLCWQSPCFAQAVAYTLSCSGVVTTGSDGSALCTDGSGSVVSWQSVPPFDVSQLDFGQAGEAFAAGFVLIGMCGALGFAVGVILKTVSGRWRM